MQTRCYLGRTSVNHISDQACCGAATRLPATGKGNHCCHPLPCRQGEAHCRRCCSSLASRSCGCSGTASSDSVSARRSRSSYAMPRLQHRLTGFLHTWSWPVTW